MSSLLTDLYFGQPSQDELRYINTKNYLDPLFETLSQIIPPDNESEVVKKELTDLLAFSNSLSQDEAMKKKYMVYDAGLLEYIESVIKNQSLNYNETISVLNDLNEDITPLLLKLKYHFLRVRPKQLSFYYSLKLFPVQSRSADSPAYPSIFAFQAKIICHVLGNIYPKYHAQFMDLYFDISLSRISMGLNYQSDIDMAIYAADLVLGNNDFKKKYKL